jgi:hypothetical protein
MQVKVWNTNTHDLVERFKGNELVIPAGKYIEMEYYEANEFRGQYHPRPVDNDGKMVDDAKHYKMLRIESPGDQAPPTKSVGGHVCMKCQSAYQAKDELDFHVKTKHANDARLELPEQDAALASQLEQSKKLKGESQKGASVAKAA